MLFFDGLRVHLSYWLNLHNFQSNSLQVDRQPIGSQVLDEVIQSLKWIMRKTNPHELPRNSPTILQLTVMAR